MALKKASAYLGGLDTSKGSQAATTGATGAIDSGGQAQSVAEKEAGAQAANASASIAGNLYHPGHPGTNAYEQFTDTANQRSVDTRSNTNEMAGEDLATKQKFTPEQYDPNYYNNVAKGEDPDGQLNGKTFESTMHASRLADYYNNRPQDNQVFAYNSTGSGGTMYENNTRPQINTQEMRQMREAEKLDEQRKTGRINVQNVVDTVPMADINTYKNQISANTEAVRNLQNQIISAMATSKAGQESSVNTTEFAQKLAAHLKGKQVQIVMQAIRDGDFQVASLLTGIFGGGQTLITQDDFYSGAYQRMIGRLSAESGYPYAYLYSMGINNPQGFSELARNQFSVLGNDR